MTSVWHQSASIDPFPALKGDIETEVAVIGGGLAGINIAYALQKRGIDVVVLESNRVGSGQTGNTTAKITSQHGLIYDKLVSTLGEDGAAQYARANEAAIDAYRRVIRDEGIDCDFVDQPAYLYSSENTDMLSREADAARLVGIDASLTTVEGLPFPVAQALRFDHQAMFHPLKYLYVLTSMLHVFENTTVLSVEGEKISAENGSVRANHVVFATHYPFINTPGYYFLRMHQERSYVVALKNASMPEGMFIGIDEGGYSLRRYNDLLLFGGSGHKTGDNAQGGRYHALAEAAARFWPNSRVVTQWSAQDCHTLDGVPYIGAYAASAPNWYVATGFHKWGMTNSMVSAMILCDLIQGQHNPYAEAFSPQRFDPIASASEFIKLGATSAKGLLQTFIGIPHALVEDVGPCQADIVTHGEEKIGVYKDEEGRIYAVDVRCTHLGCQLAWNADELSWDCPCHGSRFDYHGRLLNNPALEDLTAYDIDKNAAETQLPFST
jgi:glycine/D-amino acid oxidase-like deaminating enzyme/nitrite reductase/ring-hydroxylating ferredoxin subunit